MAKDSETKHGNKNGKKEGVSGSSFFTWFMVIALLGVWTSVAVVWFELVDYEEVLAKAKDFQYNFSEVLQGKLGIYDADGDGDFDVDDAKILLGLKERSVLEQPTLEDAEEVIHQPADQQPIRAAKEEHRSAEAEPEDEIDSLLREALNLQLGEIDEEHEETQFQQEENNEIPEDTVEVPAVEADYDGEFEDKMLDILTTPESFQEESPSDHEVREPELHESHDNHEYDTEVEENIYEPVEADAGELTLEDALVHETELFSEAEEQQDYVDEHEMENGDYVQTQDTDGEPVTEHHYEVFEEETLQAEPIDSAEQRNENGADAVGTTTEHSKFDEREHENDHMDGQPHEKEVPVHAEGHLKDDLVGQGKKEAQRKEAAKKKKPKLFNKFDKGIKAELEAAEKLRKKGKAEDALKAFETLVSKYPTSPRARYGKAQSEDDLAEKMRSNEMLQRAISTYGEVASLPSVPNDLVKLTLKRRADRQQFLGRMKGSLVTLQKLVSLFPNDTSFKNNLGVGYLLIGDNSNAKKIYEEVLNLAPNDGFAKVHYGFILKAENKIAESVPYLKEGLESGDPGTDDGRFYFHLGDAMQRVGNKEAYKWYELGHQRGHFASVWQRSLYNVKGIRAQPWWTAKETGYTELVKSLERNWKIIRDEGLAVMDKGKGLFLPEDENLREKGDWSQFTLWQQGRKNDNACKSVPKTCTLLERFPEAIGCRRGQIKYSVMHPGTHVWPHTGPTNCRLRMHLGLVVPKEGCRIRCAEETRSWEEGKVLIFDDSFEHEVWQDASAYRLIFIVDVWHPELTAQQRRTLPAI
ncbi:aspartyl/asparaginyl beta-hydroxylase isoform X2 [Sphaerodactylus townsendi]|uniref:aspartyl/asparaginyl beta-hydroxylase isoform X2 n=1 Tax=Sphaerodactylus townsendi TaxID=933632 RepID=UPI002026D7B0|nr:aspartyl/asparaginyl beta-hydroxylase isoform X2 [Sphaerodactylus townsendi]